MNCDEFSQDKYYKYREKCTFKLRQWQTETISLAKINTSRIRIMKAEENSRCRPRISRLSRATANERATSHRYVSNCDKKPCPERNCHAWWRGPWEGWKGNSSSGGGLSLLATWSGSFSRVLNERNHFRKIVSLLISRSAGRKHRQISSANGSASGLNRGETDPRSALAKSTVHFWILYPIGRSE